MKQSLYPYLPVLDPPAIFEQGCVSSGCALVADVDGVPFLQARTAFPRDNDSFSAFIGPPGGLAPEELSVLENRGFIAVKISETRLTTELASVVMSSLIMGTYQLR